MNILKYSLRKCGIMRINLAKAHSLNFLNTYDLSRTYHDRTGGPFRNFHSNSCGFINPTNFEALLPIGSHWVNSKSKIYYSEKISNSQDGEEDSSFFVKMIEVLEEEQSVNRKKYYLNSILILLVLGASCALVMLIINKRRERIRKQTVSKLVDKIGQSISKGELEEFINKNFVEKILKNEDFLKVFAEVLKRNIVENEKNMEVVKTLLLAYLKNNEELLSESLCSYFKENLFSGNPEVEELVKNFLLGFCDTEYGKEVFKEVVVMTLSDEVMKDRNSWLLMGLLDDEDIKRRYEEEIRRGLILYILQDEEINKSVKKEVKRLLVEMSK